MTWQERHGEKYDGYPNRWTVIREPLDGVAPVILATVPASELAGIDKRWQPPPTLDLGADQVVLRYRVWFPEGFPFDGGGKLAGLAAKPSGVFDLAWGGSRPGDSWSARLLFGIGGQCGIYLYAERPQPASGFGAVAWFSNPASWLATGWNIYELRIRMNTPGRNDGFVSAQANGHFGAHIPNVELRTANYPTLGPLIVLCAGGFGGDISSAPGTDMPFAFANFELLVAGD